MKQKQKQELEEQSENTRSSIVEKLEVIEDRISQTATDVKTSINEFARKLNVSDKVKKHPLSMVATSTVVGFILGSLAFRNSPHRMIKGLQASSHLRLSSGKGILQDIANDFEDEIKMIKGMAVSAGLRFLEKQSRAITPKIAPYFEKILESLNQKLGAQNLEGAHEDKPEKTAWGTH
jgi:ElaB/YqjD/DUF883 family membrane-anchored ribosome-binding protein